MEILNSNERQGRSIKDIEGNYKVTGFALFLFAAMIVYVFLHNLVKSPEIQLKQTTAQVIQKT